MLCEDYPDECEQLQRQDQANRQRQRELMRHPDPRDPDYPGDMEEDDCDD